MSARTWQKVGHLRVANPHWPIIVFAALLWMYYLYIQLLGTPNTLGQPVHHVMHHHTQNLTLSSFWLASVNWMIMVYAMMLPMTSSVIRALMRSLPVARHTRGLTIFITGYSIVWFMFGTTLLMLTHFTERIDLAGISKDIPIAAITYLIVGGISNGTYRMQILTACGTIWAPRILGLKADIDVFNIGLNEGGKCIKTCAHVMLAMHIAGHSFTQMAILTAALCYEKHKHRNKENILRNTCFILAIIELLAFSQRSWL